MPTAFRLLLTVCLLGAASVGAALLPPPGADLASALDEALDGKQTSLEPVDFPVEPSRAPSGAASAVAAPAGAFMQLLTYLLLAAGVVLLVTLAFQRFVERRGTDTGSGAEDAHPTPDESLPAVPGIPEAAGRAAARGDYGEALRLLLGEVLPRFYRGRGDHWPEAFTSRQCLRLVDGAEPARSELSDLVVAVEHHHFGGRPAVASDWDHWRSRAAALHPAGATEATT